MSGMHEDRYPTINDASLRLWNSIIRYNNEFYWCSPPKTDSDNASNRVCLYDLATGLYTKSVLANDALLDVASPALGWMMVGDHPIFICRAPYRKQKQGVSNECLQYFTGKTHDYYRLENSTLKTKEFYNMLIDKSIPYNEAYKIAQKTGLGCVISREFAILPKKNYLALYRNLTECGKALPEGVQLLDRFNNSLTVLALADKGVAVA